MEKGWGKSPHPPCNVLLWSRSAGQSQELGRVRRRSALADLEVQVAARGAAGAAHFRDLRAAQHDFPDLDQALGSVRVTRHQVIAVIDFDHITILRVEI